MKKITLIILLIISFQSKAQMFGKNPIINLENWDKQRVYWGYYLGMSSYDFKFEYKNAGEDILVENGIGFNVDREFKINRIH